MVIDNKGERLGILSTQDALEKVLKAVQDIGSVESKPTFEGRSYFTILAPVRRKENAKT